MRCVTLPWHFLLVVVAANSLAAQQGGDSAFLPDHSAPRRLGAGQSGAGSPHAGPARRPGSELGRGTAGAAGPADGGATRGPCLALPAGPLARARRPRRHPAAGRVRSLSARAGRRISLTRLSSFCNVAPTSGK